MLHHKNYTSVIGKLYFRTIIIAIFINLIPIFSSAINDVNTNAKLKYFQYKVNEVSEPFEIRCSFYDSIINIYSNIKNNYEEAIKYRLKKAKMTYEYGEYTKAFNTYKSILEDIDQKGDKKHEEQKKECIYQLGFITLNIGIYDESIRYMYTLIKYNNDKNINYTAKTYSLLGGIFIYTDNIQSAKEYHLKALSIVNNNDTLSNSSKFTVYNNYAGFLYYQKNYDSTLYYLIKSHDYCKDPQDQKQNIRLFSNLAIVYQHIGNYDMAEDYNKEALKLTNDHSISYEKALVLSHLGSLYFETQQYDKAKNTFQQAIYITKKINANLLTGEIMIMLSKLEYNDKNYKTAYDYLEKGKKLNDSIFNFHNMGKIMIMKNNFEADKIKMEKEILEQTLTITKLNNDKKNILLIITISISLIFTVAIIMIIIKLVKQYKINTTLSNKLSDMYKQEEESIKNAQMIYQETIDAKNRELTSNALSLMQISEMFNDIKSNFKKLITSEDEDERSNIAKEINSIINSTNTETGWSEFKLCFEQIHSSFFEKLETAHPDLSIGELRLCALLVLNMSMKEIAVITNRTTRSIETYVYRLKKKMNVSPEVKLITYLKHFSE